MTVNIEILKMTNSIIVFWMFSSLPLVTGLYYTVSIFLLHIYGETKCYNCVYWLVLHCVKVAQYEVFLSIHIHVDR